MPRLRSSSLVALVALASVLAACGGSKSPSVASIGTTTSPGTTTTAAAPSQDQLRRSLLRYAACMRAHGVSNFPDPSGGGFEVNGVDRSSPTFKTAQTACRPDLPGGGPGSGPPPSTRELTHMDRVAACMRRHGVSDFPDPATRVPSPPPDNGVVSDIEGVIFVFAQPAELQSPAFVRAAAVCSFPLHNR